MGGDGAALRVTNMSARYGTLTVLRRVSLHVREGEIVALIGANGAGKSTFLRALSGIHRECEGEVHFFDESIHALSPERIVRRGLSLVPEARELFPNMTVLENLELGGFVRRKSERAGLMAEVFSLFPVLSERRGQKAGTLSGGEQQMLSIGRALMARPRLLVLDEPSFGLAPLIVEEIYRTVAALRERGATILLVEQNAVGALAIADRAYVLETGRVVLSGSAPELLAHDDVRRAYLGTDYDHKWER